MSHPETATALREAVDRYLEEIEPIWDTDDIELDALRLNQLRALGYKIE